MDAAPYASDKIELCEKFMSQRTSITCDDCDQISQYLSLPRDKKAFLIAANAKMSDANDNIETLLRKLFPYSSHDREEMMAEIKIQTGLQADSQMHNNPSASTTVATDMAPVSRAESNSGSKEVVAEFFSAFTLR